MTISDQGAGIEPQAREAIYKAFFSTKGQNGMGLGLWVTSGIIDRHHGTIMLRSSIVAGRSGTISQIFLPY